MLLCSTTLLKGKGLFNRSLMGTLKAVRCSCQRRKAHKNRLRNCHKPHDRKKSSIKLLKEKVAFPGEHAMSYQQVSDYRWSVSGHSKTSKAPDAVVELMQMCKVESRDPGTAFVRRVHSPPELQVILCTNRQLKELEQFCTNPELFSPLSVDVTFNMGDFYVAVTTYRNLLLKTKNNCHLVMIGPIMLHQQRLY